MLFLETLIYYVAQALTLLIIVRTLLSWVPSVDYGHPVIRAIVRVTDPVMLPIRRLIPPLGGLDVTPIVALLLIQFASRLLLDVVRAALGGV
jgi:YggT family protein